MTIATMPSNAIAVETSASPLHIVHVVLSLDVGGLERVVLSLAMAARRRGHRVSIVCVDRRGTLADEAEAMGAKVVCAEKGAGLKPRIIGVIARQLTELSPDVVHTHQIAALLYAGRAARRVGVPVVHTEHGKHYATRRKTRWLGKIASRPAARFFCVSADIAADVKRFKITAPSKIGVAPNGIDLAAFEGPSQRDATRMKLGISPFAAVVGAVGRLSPIKRHDLLIEGFARLPGNVDDPHLLIVGDGPTLDSLRELATRLNISDRVHFAGYQSNPRQFIEAMDVLAMTSESEGMPLAVLEAWACGVPVVASRVGGLPELIQHGSNGLLFPFADQSAFVGAISQVLTDRLLATDLAARATAQLEARYTLMQTAQQYESAYRAVMASK